MLFIQTEKGDASSSSFQIGFEESNIYHRLSVDNTTYLNLS